MSIRNCRKKTLREDLVPKGSRAPVTVGMPRPTKAQLLAAYGKPVPDVIAPRLKVLFVGINPGLYSGAVGHHFARPGNRFWPVLHRAKFTAQKLSPAEERILLKLRYGITNIVNRSTAAAAELDHQELKTGGRRLAVKIKRFRPRVVAILGLEAFRVAFGQPRARFGPQKERIHKSQIWVLPNPSGLNASYQLPALTRMFRQVRLAAGGTPEQDRNARRTRNHILSSSLVAR